VEITASGDVYDDVYYRLFFSGSDVVYVVAESPEGADNQG
jgi:hypothetical protein